MGVPVFRVPLQHRFDDHSHIYRLITIGSFDLSLFVGVQFQWSDFCNLCRSLRRDKDVAFILLFSLAIFSAWYTLVFSLTILPSSTFCLQGIDPRL